MSAKQQRRVEYLGEGSQGVVYCKKDRKTNKALVYKVYKSSNVSTCFGEIKMLKLIKRLSLKHSVEFEDTFWDKNNQLCVVMRKAEGEDLFEYFTKFVSVFSVSDARTIFKKIVMAVDELHSNNICHLDLKLENIIYDPKKLNVTLIDFGFADVTKDENSSNERILKKYRGSKHYTAPEILHKVPYHGTKADVWALGVLLYILVVKKFPFPGKTVPIEEAVLAPVNYPNTLPPTLVNLMDSMLKFEPSLRTNTKAILQHPWLNSDI